MRTRDWRTAALSVGILKEPVREDNRLVFWLPASRDPEYQYWERIATAPRGEIQIESGVLSTPATSILTRQRIQNGFLGKLARKLKGTGDDESWALPNGLSTEKHGQRKTDLVLAWAEDESISLDEQTARCRWPGLTRFLLVGEGLFLIEGVQASAVGAPAHSADTGDATPEDLGCPVALAEQLLEKARRERDRAREAAALTDLGIVMMNEGKLPKAVEYLNNALKLAHELGDQSRELDALNNIGYALLAMGQPQTARQTLENGLSLAVKQGDRFAEKLILERLGMALANLRDPAGALAMAARALEMTRALGDEQQEHRLLWNQAIAYADMNQRDQALSRAQESVELLKALGKPEAAWYGAQLQRYRMDLSGLAAQAASGVQIAAASDPNTGPGLLRMAVSATRSMMKFIGSGLKTTPADLQQKRMAVCQSCEHHTGLRCRVCGCFTNVKTRMAHEQCPIGKWPG